MSDLHDRVAIVTGGGRGIGRAACLALAHAGADIAVVARTQAEIEETASAVCQLGREALAITADVANAYGADQVVEQVVQRLGTVDVLVNCAGVLGPIGPLVGNEVEPWIQTLMVNLVGPFGYSKAVLPYMIRNLRGKIINFSGGGAAYGRPYFTAYSASKAAVVRFTESLAAEVKQYNIQVNAIAPGAILTNMWKGVFEAGDNAGPSAIVEAQKVEASGGDDLGKVLKLLLFLASDRSTALTGRLLSAHFDDWEEMLRHQELVERTGIWTLRRLDAYTIKRLHANWDLDTILHEDKDHAN